MQSGAESRAGFVQSTMQCKMDCRLCNAEGVLLYYFALRSFAPRSINCCAAQCCAKPSRERGREGGAVKLYKIRCAKSCAIQSGAHCKKEEAKCNAVQNRAERERGAVEETLFL